jgi:hypothetical protein
MTHLEFSLEDFMCNFLPALDGVSTFDRGGNQIWRGEHSTHGSFMAVGSPQGAVQVIFER